MRKGKDQKEDGNVGDGVKGRLGRGTGTLVGRKGKER